MRIISILLISIFSFLSVYGQTKIDPRLSWRQKYSIAKDLYQRNSYYNAIDFYKSVLADNPGHLTVKYFLANSYRNIRDYYSSEKFYKEFIALETQKFPEARFEYGLVLKNTGNYQGAKATFQFVIDNGLLPKYYIDWAEREIEGCDLALAMAQDEDFNIRLLDETINSPFSESAPFAITESEFTFSAVRSDTAIVLNDSLWAMSGEALSRIYMSKVANDVYYPPAKFSNAINDDTHSANATFSADSKYFVFTNCTTDSLMNVRCDIYLSTKKEGQFTEPIRLPNYVNSPNANNTHPSVLVGDDNKYVLYFASNRDGGEGGMDIYATTFDEYLNFTPAKNMGNVINTPQDEMTPYYDNERNVLYFSSNGLPNIGGLDVFKVKQRDGQWQTPVNLGMPINSTADDMYYTIYKNQLMGYYVSNRPGGFSLKSETCCDDIYKFSVKKLINAYGFAYQIGDTAFAPIEGVTVSIYTKDKHGNYKVESTYYSDSMRSSFTDDYKLETGTEPDNLKSHFEFDLKAGKDYKIVAAKDGYLSSTKELSAEDIVNENDRFKKMLFTIDKIDKDKTYTLDNIYYDYNSAELREESMVVLDAFYDLLENNPNIIIELSAHTDSRGSDSYNMRLSQQRAENSVTYLIEKGMAENRLQARGYGELELLNECTNGVECIDELHQQNRRTQFKVVGELKSSSHIDDQSKKRRRKAPVEETQEEQPVEEDADTGEALPTDD